MLIWVLSISLCSWLCLSYLFLCLHRLNLFAWLWQTRIRWPFFGCSDVALKIQIKQMALYSFDRRSNWLTLVNVFAEQNDQFYVRLINGFSSNHQPHRKSESNTKTFRKYFRISSWKAGPSWLHVPNCAHTWAVIKKSVTFSCFDNISSIYLFILVKIIV